MMNRMIRLAALIVRIPLQIVGEVTDRLADVALGKPEPFAYQYSTTPEG